MGQPEHLLDVVTGKQDRRALFPQAQDKRLDLGCLFHPERRRGLVQHKQARPLPHRAGDGDKLALAAGKGPDAAGGVPQRDPQALQHLCRGRVEPAFREHEAPWLLPQQDVGRHVQVVAQRQVLPDHADSPAGRGARVGGHLPARKEDLTAGRGDVAGDAPHQRRLARAVLAGQGDKLARLHGKVDAVESAHRPEAGVEPGHCQQRGRRLVGAPRQKRGHLGLSSLIQRLTPGTLGHCGTWAPAPPSPAGRGPFPSCTRMAVQERAVLPGGRRPMAAEMLSRRALNRALLERQMLLCRTPLPEGPGRAERVIETVEHLGGLQAQAPFPPYYGLWSRLAGFRPGDLADLLLNRAVVRIALMRGTIHLVSARDCLLLRPLIQPVLDRAMSTTYGKQLSGVDTGELAAAGRVLVEEKPRTFSELGTLLCAQWPDNPPAALAQKVRALVPLVQVPPRAVWGLAGQAAHTSAESWLGRDLEAGPRLDDLVVRYLAAFGPATVMDMQCWSGLTRLREA